MLFPTTDMLLVKHSIKMLKHILFGNILCLLRRDIGRIKIITAIIIRNLTPLTTMEFIERYRNCYIYILIDRA